GTTATPTCSARPSTARSASSRRARGRRGQVALGPPARDDDRRDRSRARPVRPSCAPRDHRGRPPARRGAGLRARASQAPDRERTRAGRGHRSRAVRVRRRRLGDPVSARYDLVLLDLDGTLADSAPGILASVRHAYAALGVATPAEPVLRGFVGPPLAESFATHGVPPDLVDDAVAAYREVYGAGNLF